MQRRLREAPSQHRTDRGNLLPKISRFLSQRRARGSKVWSWRHIYCLQLAYEHPIVVATVFEVWRFAKVVVSGTINCNFGIEIEFPNIMQNNLIVLQKELSKLLVGHLWLCQHDSLLTLCTYMDLVETDIILKSQIQLKSLNIWWESITWLRVFARRLIWTVGRKRKTMQCYPHCLRLCISEIISYCFTLIWS